jgi:hypothetical protein
VLVGELLPDTTAAAVVEDAAAASPGLPPDSARFASASPDVVAVEEGVAPDEDASPVDF